MPATDSCQDSWPQIIDHFAAKRPFYSEAFILQRSIHFAAKHSFCSEAFILQRSIHFSEGVARPVQNGNELVVDGTEN
jgi:hypothetical protein